MDMFVITASRTVTNHVRQTTLITVCICSVVDSLFRLECRGQKPLRSLGMKMEHARSKILGLICCCQNYFWTGVLAPPQDRRPCMSAWCLHSALGTSVADPHFEEGRADWGTWRPGPQRGTWTESFLWVTA